MKEFNALFWQQMRLGGSLATKDDLTERKLS